MALIDPTHLDPIITDLRSNAEHLRQLAGQVRGERVRIDFAGPRAERFFAKLEDRADTLGARAEEVDRIADNVVLLRADVVRELEILAGIKRAVEDFLSEVQRAAERAWEEAQSANEKLWEGDFEGAAEDVGDAFGHLGDVFAGWRWSWDNLPAPGDNQWREVNGYMAVRSGTRGVAYNGPVPA